METAKAIRKTVAKKTQKSHKKSQGAIETPWDLEFGIWDLPARLLPAATATPPAAAAATASTSTTATATTETTAAPRRHRPRFVHGERPASEALLVELRDRILRILLGRHFHEREAASASGLAVPHDANSRHLARLRKQLIQVVFIDVVREIADIQFVAHGHSAHRIDALWKRGALGAGCSGLAGAEGCVARRRGVCFLTCAV